MNSTNAFMSVKLLLGVTVLLIWVGGYWLLHKQSQIGVPPVFRVVGDKIFKESQLFFVNVNGVKEARLGPDGTTVHFKTDGSKGAALCANLATKIEQPSSNYLNPPPRQVPWDYQRIGHAYTLNDCGGLAGGYLKNSDHFSYLIIDKGTKKGVLVVEDANAGTVLKLNIDPALLAGFLDGDNKRINSYWGTEIVSSDGKNYYYPHNDSYEINGKLVLSFARLILAADTNKQSFLGGFALIDPEYNVVATSFWFHTKEGIPVIIIESGWEGVYRYEALVDISGEKIKIEKITNLDKSGFGLFELRNVSWLVDGVALNLYTEEDVSSRVRDISERIKIDEDIRGIKAAEDKAVDRLKKDKSYYDVKCIFSPGIIAGCFAAINPVSYQYKPSGRLQKL